MLSKGMIYLRRTLKSELRSCRAESKIYPASNQDTEEERGNRG